MEYGLPQLKKYPVDTKENIQKCVKYFHHCPENLREELANNVYKASLREGVEIDGNSDLFRYVNFDEEIAMEAYMPNVPKLNTQIERNRYDKNGINLFNAPPTEIKMSEIDELDGFLKSESCVGSLAVPDVSAPLWDNKYIDKTDIDGDNPEEIVYKEDIIKLESEDESKINKNYKPNGHLNLNSFNKINITEELAKKYDIYCNEPTLQNFKGYIYTDKHNSLVALIAVATYNNKKSWIQPMEISKKYRGYGLSKQLLDVAVKELGAKYLAVYIDNEVAINIYKKYGFKIYKKVANREYFMTIDPRQKISEKCIGETFDIMELLGESKKEVLTEAPKSKKRQEIETLIYNFFNIIDVTGMNTKKYKEMFDGMTDEQFNKYMKKFLYDDNQNFYLEILPNKNEPNLKQIKKCADLLKIPLDEYVYYRHDGDKDNPVRTSYRVPVGYLILKRMQQTLSKKNTYSLSISSRNMKTGQNSAHYYSDIVVNTLLTAGTSLSF